MKARLTSLTLGASVLALFATGCAKQETKGPAATAPAAAAAPATAADAQAAMKATADKAMAQTKEAAAALSAQAQTTIDKAKSLIGEKKYQDALTSLQALAMSKLSPEHKKTVDDLIAQAQKLMSSDMGKAVQGVMKK